MLDETRLRTAADRKIESIRESRHRRIPVTDKGRQSLTSATNVVSCIQLLAYKGICQLHPATVKQLGIFVQKSEYPASSLVPKKRTVRSSHNIVKTAVLALRVEALLLHWLGLPTWV